MPKSLRKTPSARLIDKTERYWWLAAVLVVIVAICFRFYRLGEIPSSLYWDEAAMLVDAKSVAGTGHDMHGRPWYQVLYPSYGDYKLPLYIWLASFSVKIWGVTEWALRLSSAVAGVLTVITGGVLAFELTKRRAIAITTMLVLATSPWSILFSRTAFEGHVAQLLVAVSAVVVVRSRLKLAWLVLAGLIGGLATYGYFSVRFVWPIVYVGLILWVWWHQAARRTWTSLVLVKSLVGLLVFGLMLIPMLRSPLYQDSNRFRLGTDSVLKNDDQVLQSNVYRELAGNTPIDRIIFHRWWLTAQELFKNYSDNLSLNYYFVTGDPNLRHGTGSHGLFLVMGMPFFLIGWWQLIAKKPLLAIALAAWWWVALLPASVPENTPHALRSLNALVPLSMVIGVGLVAIIDKGQSILKSQPHLKKLPTQTAAVVILGLVAINGGIFGYHYFNHYSADSRDAWQPGYRELAQTIVQERESSPVYVSQIDDKFYLWLMAYGPYTGQDFRTWTSQGYQFKSFDSIFFQAFPDWAGVPNQDSRVIIVLPATEQTALQRPDFNIIDTKVIKNQLGEAVFVVAKVDRQNK